MVILFQLLLLNFTFLIIKLRGTKHKTYIEVDDESTWKITTLILLFPELLLQEKRPTS